MKAFFILLLLLPLCLGDYEIRCKGEDFLMVRNMDLTCRGKTQQACYTRRTGEKGCVRLEYCSKPGWKCCNEDMCNA